MTSPQKIFRALRGSYMHNTETRSYFHLLYYCFEFLAKVWLLSDTSVHLPFEMMCVQQQFWGYLRVPATRCLTGECDSVRGARSSTSTLLTLCNVDEGLILNWLLLEKSWSCFYNLETENRAPINSAVCTRLHWEAHFVIHFCFLLFLKQHVAFLRFHIFGKQHFCFLNHKVASSFFTVCWEFIVKQ